VSANLDLVRSIYADWERGDFSNADWADPEIEIVGVDGPAPSISTGVAAMADQWAAYLSTWEDYRVTAQRYLETDDGRVLVFNLMSGRGRVSGLEVGQTEATGAALFELRDGRVKRLAVYFDPDRALADLGLEE
jgi:ketosteroid isomerase-like protein